MLSRGYCRLFQKTAFIFMRFLRFPLPKEIHSVQDFSSSLKQRNISKILIVTGPCFLKNEEFLRILNDLENDNISYEVFSSVNREPDFALAEAIKDSYLKNECEGMLSIGGGSVIDASKAASLLIKDPEHSLEHFRGMLKVRKGRSYLCVVPTTAGTGSEATVAAVVVNQKNGDKFSINDPHLIPDEVFFDDEFLKTVPQHLIAESGMDALTHALEAYIGKSGTQFTDQYALKALSMIHMNLLNYYYNPEDDIARKRMQMASYDAGVAFTRAYVGYVHALAHAIGGKYHLGHGYCIAILLPYVLLSYGKTIDKKMAHLYDLWKLGKEKDNDVKRSKVIEEIISFNARMKIPSSFNGLIKEEDYQDLAEHASKEANPWYPVPKEMNVKELKDIIIKANGRS